MRKSLRDIVASSPAEDITTMWSTTEAAQDFTPLPGGSYEAELVSGELFNARSGTPGFKVCWQIVAGEHAGRKLWDDFWLTAAALPGTKRDLLKLGIDNPAKLERPIPRGIIARLRVVLRRDDDGTEHNRIRGFEVLRIETPKPDPFAPAEPPAEATEPQADTSFDYGHNKGAEQ